MQSKPNVVVQSSRLIFNLNESRKKPPLNTQMGPNPFRNRIETVKTFHDRLFFQTFKSVICNEKFCENVS